MAKYTFLTWMLASPLIAGGIAWIVQHAFDGMAPVHSHCAVAESCEIMPSNEGSEF